MKELHSQIETVCGRLVERARFASRCRRRAWRELLTLKEDAHRSEAVRASFVFKRERITWMNAAREAREALLRG